MKYLLANYRLDRMIQKEKPVEVMDSLILPPTNKALEDTIQKNNSDDLSKAERKQQQEEKYKVYQRTYVGQLSEEEESNTESDYSSYSYFG